jgi:hypothetical protein
MLISENDLTGQTEWVGEEYGQRNFAAGGVFSGSAVAFEGDERVEVGFEPHDLEVSLTSTLGAQSGYHVAASLSEDFDMGSFDIDNEIDFGFGSSYSMGAESLENDQDFSPTTSHTRVECNDDLTINALSDQCQSCGSFLAAQSNTMLEASGVMSTGYKAMDSYQFPK